MASIGPFLESIAVDSWEALCGGELMASISRSSVVDVRA
jgi:hypothetical protein